LAQGAASQALLRIGASHVRVATAAQNVPCPTVALAAKAAALAGEPAAPPSRTVP